MQATLLLWYAVNLQNSTFRQQKLILFYIKFGLEFNELNLNFQKQQEIAKNAKK